MVLGLKTAKTDLCGRCHSTPTCHYGRARAPRRPFTKKVHALDHVDLPPELVEQLARALAKVLVASVRRGAERA